MPDFAAEFEQLQRRVAHLEAKDAIRSLVTAYAVACDEHDIPRLADLFTQDAVFGSPNGAMVSTGRDAIREMFIETFKIRGPAFHWTHDVTVTMDKADPNQATGLVYSHAETTPNNVVSLAAMRYHDSYRCESGVWRFATRSISFLYYVPATEYAQGLVSEKRVVIGGERLAADYPESLAPWQAYASEHL